MVFVLLGFYIFFIYKPSILGYPIYGNPRMENYPCRPAGGGLFDGYETYAGAWNLYGNGEHTEYD